MDATKGPRGGGEVPSPEDYRTLLDSIDSIENDDERAKRLEAFMREPQRPMLSLELLKDSLLKLEPAKTVEFLVGGPLTAIKSLLALGGDDLEARVHSMHMMYGAWDNAKPESVNLFPNQFNVGADVSAASDLCLDRQKKHGHRLHINQHMGIQSLVCTRLQKVYKFD